MDLKKPYRSILVDWRPIYWGFLCAFFWGIAFPLSAQIHLGFSTIRYNEESGFDATDAFGITQDENGYLWIGSDNGIFRFDGTSFKRFGYEEGFESRMAVRLYRLDRGRIFVVGELPNRLYEIKGDSVVPVNLKWQSSLAAETEAQFNDSVYYNIDFGQKTLWALHTSGKIDSIPLLKPMPFGMQKLGEELFLVVGFYNIYYHLVEGEIKVKQINSNIHENVLHFVRKEDGSVWGATSSGIYRRQGESWEFMHSTPFEDINFVVTHMEWDGQDGLWMSDRNQGIYLYDYKRNMLRSIDHLLDLKNVQITSMFVDRDQNLWLATAGQGLVCVTQKLFTKFQIEDNEISPYITALYKSPDGYLWVGSNSGLYKLSFPDSGLMPEFHFVHNQNYVLNIGPHPEKGVYSAVSDRNNALYRDLWYEQEVAEIYTRDLIYLYDSSYLFGSWARIQLGEFELESSRGFCIDSTVIIGGRTEGTVNFEDETWILTTSNLYSWKDSMVALNFFDGNINADLLVFNDIEYESDSAIWIGSNFGVYQLNRKGIQQELNVDSGLLSNQCLNLETDPLGALWIATDKGLCRYYQGEIQSFTVTSGLPANYVSRLEFDHDLNCLWIGTAQGLSRLNMQDISSLGHEELSLKIDELEIMGDTIYQQPGDRELSSDQSSLRIHYTALKYTHPNEVKYRYRLNGAQKNWVETTQNTVEYLALAPGNYSFEVQSRVPGNSWGPSATLSFLIQKPLWLRWYVLLGIMLTTVALTYYGLNERLKRIRKEEVQKRKTLSTINRLEQSALQLSMNPHFVFNSLNSIQHFFTRHKDPKAIDFVAEFASLIRFNMEAGRKRTIPLDQEITNLKRYLRLEAVRLEQGLDYQVEAHPEMDTQEYSIPSMLVQPFVENAVWHGIRPANRRGKIRVYFDLYEDFLRVEIVDNGIGIKKGKLLLGKGHVSRGIELSRKRMELLSPKNRLEIEEIDAEKSPPGGTRIGLWLYLGRSEMSET